MYRNMTQCNIGNYTTRTRRLIRSAVHPCVRLMVSGNKSATHSIHTLISRRVRYGNKQEMFFYLILYTITCGHLEEEMVVQGTVTDELFYRFALLVT